MFREEGISLIEVLIALIIIVIAALSLLQLTAHLIQLQRASLEHWERAVRNWSAAEAFRASIEEAEVFQLTPDSGLLRRQVIETGSGEHWEVIDEAR